MLVVEETMALRNSEGEKRRKEKEPLTDGLEALSFTFNCIGYEGIKYQVKLAPTSL